MLQKLALYYNTVKYMKLSQIYYRIRKMLHLECTLGCKARNGYDEVHPLVTVTELDFDSDFLKRFSVEELMQDRVTFLYCSEDFSWNEKWEIEEQSALWNFNLHYFEFLFPLVKSWKETKNEIYWEKIKQCIEGWIKNNPKQGGGPGWAAYTIALRLTNWISVYTLMQQEIEQDIEFKKKMLDSMYEQYVYLSCHLEKDLRGNHYFEDLKALVLCSIFFDDEILLEYALEELKKQCKEQILEDGMHFELSPMYHKIIFEDVVRVAVALREAGHRDEEMEMYLKPMLDVAYSFEEGLERIPLFNDCGNNVAKSLDALLDACRNHFQLLPNFKASFPISGYYIFKQGDIKVIVDAGQPGPTYIPGHAHCDAMSFEVFKSGKPVIVNCGTYAYQCEERSFFRSTAAHNTVMVDGVEQSQCWGAFRMAKRCRMRSVNITVNGISMEMQDYKGNFIKREINVKEKMVTVSDCSEGAIISSFLHVLSECKERMDDSNIWTNGSVEISCTMNCEAQNKLHAYEYGRLMPTVMLSFIGNERGEWKIVFS